MAVLCVRTRNVIRGSRGGERESKMCLTEHAPRRLRPPSGRSRSVAPAGSDTPIEPSSAYRVGALALFRL
jgi:hypothetical protein